MIDLILFGVILISVVTDLYNRRILNVVTLPAIVIGFIWYTSVSGLQGFLFSGKGFLLGLGLLVVPFILGGIGAGDVKLLAAVGALKGSAFVFSSFLYMAIAGGIIACFLLLRKGELQKSVSRIFYVIFYSGAGKEAWNVLDKSELHHAFPYGLAIGIGTIAAYIWGGV